MSDNLPHYSDQDIDDAYQQQQNQLDKWGVKRTSLSNTYEKRVALRTWLFDLMVNERARYAKAILFDEAPIDFLNDVVKRGYKLYQDTLDTLFSEPHQLDELRYAQSAMAKYAAQQDQEWLIQKEQEIAARQLFDDAPIRIHVSEMDDEQPSTTQHDEVDFFVVTGDNSSIGVYENETGNFIATKLSDKISKRRQKDDNDNNNLSAPSLG